MAETSSVYSPEVVAAIMRHMNDDHADDSVLIYRAFGGPESATAARMTGMDESGIQLSANVDGRDTEVTVPWSEPIRERAQVRAEVVRMYNEACSRLGLEPRPPH